MKCTSTLYLTAAREATCCFFNSARTSVRTFLFTTLHEQDSYIITSLHCWVSLGIFTKKHWDVLSATERRRGKLRASAHNVTDTAQACSCFFSREKHVQQYTLAMPARIFNSPPESIQRFEALLFGRLKRRRHLSLSSSCRFFAGYKCGGCAEVLSLDTAATSHAEVTR